MAKYCGSRYLIQLEDSPGSGTYTSVGSLRDTTLSISNEQVDVTTKSSAVTRQLLAQCGINTISLSGSGVFSDDSTVDQMQVAAQTGDVLNCRLVSDRGDSYTGPFQLASFERTGGYNTAEEYSTTFESASAITYTAAP